MAVTPPNPRWMKAKAGVKDPATSSDLEVATQWDAGTVDAGSSSTPQEFYFWNNFMGSGTVANMIEADISVREGTLAPNRVAGCVSLPYVGPSKPGQGEGSVSVQFFDSTAKSGLGDWGYFDETTSAWKSGETTIYATAPTPVYSASGVKGTLTGNGNTGSLTTDTSNYSRMRLKFNARSDAGAGLIQWITRVSYKYT